MVYENLKKEIIANPKTWLVTGVAGFIGSSILEELLKLDQLVIGLDNFSTGYASNLEKVKNKVTSVQWERFGFIEGDICNRHDCDAAVKGVDYVLHQAALGSVPRSIVDPISTNSVNIDGFLNVMVSAKNAGVKELVYAASSSTYGDHEALPKREDNIGRPLSPYAITKYVNELYSDVFKRNYNFISTGLRYFNVFGPRQDPNGAYAAVIPRWIDAALRGDSIVVNGDGETSRDFCYIDNVVQANIVAALTKKKNYSVYNIACGNRTSLNSLFGIIKGTLNDMGFGYTKSPIYESFRDGDVRHSHADIARANEDLGYMPGVFIEEGILRTVKSYLAENGL